MSHLYRGMSWLNLNNFTNPLANSLVDPHQCMKGAGLVPLLQLPLQFCKILFLS